MNKLYSLKRVGSFLWPIRAALCVLLVTGLSPSALANSSMQEKRVTVSVSNVSYQAVFDEISRQTGYTFLFNNVQISSTARISVSAQNEPVSQVLNRIFNNSHLGYSMMGNQIIVTESSSSKPAGAQVDVTVYVNDLKTQEQLAGVVVTLPQYGIYGVTDGSGKVSLRNVPSGQTAVELQLLGYRATNLQMTVGAMTEFHYKMEQVSLSMRQVTVLGNTTSNTLSNSMTIDAQAIEHLQAVTLDDLLELLPGNESLSNSERQLTNRKTLEFRTANNATNNNNSFGAAVIVDGVQLSTNAVIEPGDNRSGINSVSGTSIDLRTVGTDNIESVEVVLGVPSAKYGDMSSGAMIVKTKVGESPWTIRGKLNPSTKQASVTKGWRMNENNSTVNMSFDYLYGGQDPRIREQQLDRILASLGFGKMLTENWNTNTRFRFGTLIDWGRKDPDAAQSVNEQHSKQYNYTFSHDGTISFNSLLSRSLSYTASISFTDHDQYATRIVSNASSSQYLMDATETGIHEASLLPKSYVAQGGAQNRPFVADFGVDNSFFVNSGEINQRFTVGMNYNFQKNYGRGDYNEDPQRPLTWNITRKQKFMDIPAMHRISAYIQDNLDMKIDGRPFSVQLGLRYDALQPFKSEFVQSLSPRVNFRYDITPSISLRGAYGRMVKTPGMDHLYPDKRYIDHVIVEHTPNEESEQLVMYHTQVLDAPHSRRLKNMVNNKYELGFNLKLPKRITASFNFFIDESKNGFERAEDFFVYRVTSYADGKGYTAHPGSGQKPTIDFLDPDYSGEYAKTAIAEVNTGITGNTAYLRNKGIEFSVGGKINPINTEIRFSGGYRETLQKSSKSNYTSTEELTSVLDGGFTHPYRLEKTQKSGTSHKSFVSAVNLVWHIPSLSLVATGRLQIRWFTYENSNFLDIAPIGFYRYIEQDGEFIREYTELTSGMIRKNDLFEHDGKTVTFSNNYSYIADKRGTWTPGYVNFDLRLSKSIGQMLNFSFYATNATYHLPWSSSNKTNTLTRKGHDLGFGAELSFKF